MVKCKTCGGKYARKDRHGILYFHSCPPIPDELNPDGSAATWKERPDHRDENIDDSDPKHIKIKAAGKGEPEEEEEETVEP